MPCPHHANLELAGLDLADRFRLRSRSSSPGIRAEDREAGVLSGGRQGQTGHQE
jgi:hypothetical protein